MYRFPQVNSQFSLEKQANLTAAKLIKTKIDRPIAKRLLLQKPNRPADGPADIKFKTVSIASLNRTSIFNFPFPLGEIVYEMNEHDPLLAKINDEPSYIDFVNEV